MLFDIQNLNVSFQQTKVLRNFSLQLKTNTILGIVGESGSGKSLSVLSILNLLPKMATLEVNKMCFDGKDLKNADENLKRKLRGHDISIIFQEPMSSLNPSMTCGEQVSEILLNHKICRRKQIKDKVLELFEKVKLPTPAQTFKKYPHQISGGQKQRVMIAMAIACKPKLLIADEPTTALDVSVQQEIILLLKQLQEETEMSIIFISHDLALVKNIANEIMVLYKGQVIEQGKTESIFYKPKESYTKALLAARPKPNERLVRLPTIIDFKKENFKIEIESKAERSILHEKLYDQKPLIEIKNLNKTFKVNSSLFKSPSFFKALDNINFDLYEGEKLGVVGESGCGKTTLGHIITGLTKADSGVINYHNQDIRSLKPKDFKKIKKDIQIIFQDPYSSLNPRISIGKSITEPMKVHSLYKTKKDREQKAMELLEAVGLSKAHYNRFPHEFSGGQRQRIGIARCLALQPKVIICDESVSALDISVQAQVLNLLEDLKKEYNLTYIFISHDLSVVRQFSDRIIVMQSGKIVEYGEADDLYNCPKTDYTKQLIEAIPV